MHSLAGAPTQGRGGSCSPRRAAPALLQQGRLLAQPLPAAASDDFWFLQGAFLQRCPKVRLDCVGSWPRFTGLSATLHQGVVTASDGVTDRQSPAAFSKPKHFATPTGKKKKTNSPTHNPLSLSRFYLEIPKASKYKTPQSHSS